METRECSALQKYERAVWVRIESVRSAPCAMLAEDDKAIRRSPPTASRTNSYW
jgi:hypothetical protein